MGDKEYPAGRGKEKTMLQNKKTTLIIMIAVGLALCGLGIYLYFFQTKGFVPTTAVMDEIKSIFESKGQREALCLESPVSRNVRAKRSTVELSGSSRNTLLTWFL